MASLFGLFRTVPQLLEKRRDSADAQWVEPGNDVTRAIYEGSAFEPAPERGIAPPVKPAVAQAPVIAAPVEAPVLERTQPAQQSVAETAQPAAEEQAERPAKRRRWHRAA